MGEYREDSEYFPVDMPVSAALAFAPLRETCISAPFPQDFPTNEMKTFSAKPHEVDRKWYVIDAKGKVLGQVAVEAARLLRGKQKPIFTTHVDTGDFVVVINADQCVLSGNKETDKIYTRFTGYVGGKKVETPQKLRERRPVLLVERAVWGMIPKTRLGRAQFGKLKVYAGESHPHEAQEPVAHEIR
jgi:large subunit ribosomal protein L13